MFQEITPWRKVWRLSVIGLALQTWLQTGPGPQEAQLLLQGKRTSTPIRSAQVFSDA